MKLDCFHVDAFAERVFEGNPAAVVPLPDWPEDGLLQAISMENNLSETAFFVPEADDFHLRWFTPKAEVALCGHATLAAAHVLYDALGYNRDSVRFLSRSGPLTVRRAGTGYSMDFPALPSTSMVIPDDLIDGLGGCEPAAVLSGQDLLVVLEQESDVAELQPDLTALARLDGRGVVVTAPGAEHDFVSRCFFPKLGVPEDPVTGSAHCQLAPWWAQRLGRTRLKARQLSARGGTLGCQVRDDRVELLGQAVTFLRGSIRL